MSEKSSPIKIILGIATIWPVVYLVIFFVNFAVMFVGNGPSKGSFFPLFIIHMLTMLFMFVLMIIYIVDVFKNPRIANDMKVLWAVVLFFGGMFAMPVYWYMYIWRRQSDVVVPDRFSAQQGAYGNFSSSMETRSHIFCPHCGIKNNVRNAFCIGCGKKIENL